MSWTQACSIRRSCVRSYPVEQNEFCPIGPIGPISPIVSGKAPMRQNHVRAKLKRGEVSIGSWISLPDPTASRLMARVGFDWLNVDLEHTPINFETAALSFAAIADEGPAPIAR